MYIVYIFLHINSQKKIIIIIIIKFDLLPSGGLFFPRGLNLYLSSPISEQVCEKSRGQLQCSAGDRVTGNQPLGPSGVLVGGHLTLKFEFTSSP